MSYDPPTLGRWRKGRLSPGVGVSAYLSLSSKTLPLAVEKECCGRGSNALPLIEAKEGLCVPVSFDRILFGSWKRGRVSPRVVVGARPSFGSDPLCLWPSKEVVP